MIGALLALAVGGLHGLATYIIICAGIKYLMEL